MVLLQVVSQRRQHGAEANAERGMVGEIDALARLGVAAGKIEDQPVADFTQHEMDLPTFIRLDGAGLFPDAVGNFRDALSQGVFRVLDHLQGDGIDQLGAILSEHLLHAGFRHVVGGDPALEIETDHGRLPRHIDDHLKEVFPECPAFDQLDPCDSDAFMENLRGSGRIAARRQSADIHDVDKSRTPGNQTVLVMNRRDHEQVRLVHRGDVRVVEQKHVVRSEALVAEALQDLFHRESPARHVHADGFSGRQDLAVRAVQRGHVVFLLRRVDGAADALERRPHLLGDLIQPVGQNLERDRVHSSRG